MTSYDEIWESFLNNCKASDIDIPQLPEKIYEAIHNAIRHFNNRLREEMKWDDQAETVDRVMTNDHLLILSHYIRYFFLVNQKTYFQSLFQPFMKDVGVKNFSSQLKSIESSIYEEQKMIDRIIMNSEEDYL
ncbi:hypothetical protein P4V41_07180 [Fictibacillus nanhaiensis]|uniref:hypothetical protein n=1 Tax=Fictibacillus nanhaiensis TaxID=742169 RepID=UPI002E1F2F92|nr:hypothetical protein [Fictibacillus nanhaiensis]